MGTREPRLGGGQCAVKHVSARKEVCDNVAGACSRNNALQLGRAQQQQQSVLLLLPQELRVEIMSRLDAHSVIRLQSVCKDLRDVARQLRLFPVAQGLTSKDENAFAPVAFLVAKGEKWIWAGYDPTARVWKWLPSLSALLVATDRPDTVLAASDGLLCASSHGLLCALVRGTIFPVTVCNPLTREHRRLPPLTKPRCPDLLHILREGRNSERFRIIASGGYSLVAGEYTIIRKTECYDSSTNSWTETSNSPPGLRLQRYQNGVYSNGFLYCLARGPQLDNLLLAYHLDSGSWVRNLGCEFLRTDDAWGGAMNAQFVTCHGAIYYYEEFHIQGTRLKGFTIDELHTIASVNPNGSLTALPAWNNPNPSPSERDSFFTTMLSSARKQGQLRRLVEDHRPLCQCRGTCVAQGPNQVCIYYPKEAKGMVYTFHVHNTANTNANEQGATTAAALRYFRKERLPEMTPSSPYLNADMMELPQTHLQPLPLPFQLSFSARVL